MPGSYNYDDDGGGDDNDGLLLLLLLLLLLKNILFNYAVSTSDSI
jgi:hypothetical protein